MKKAPFISLGLAIIISVGFFAISVNQATAQDPDPPIITHLGGVYVRQYAETVTVSTNIQTNENTTAVLKYGTSSGEYTETVDGTETTNYHTFVFDGLSYETLYYFQAEVTDQGDNTTLSDEFTYQTRERGMRIKNLEFIDTGPNGAMVFVESNFRGYVEGHYGSVSGTRPNLVYGFGLSGGRAGSEENHVHFKNLNPSATYYYDLMVGITQWDYTFWPIEGDRTDTSDELSFTTSGEVLITGINLTEGGPGTVVTISGENFGSGTSDLERRVTIGCELGSSGDCTGSGDVLTWGDTEITFRLDSRASTGSIWVGKGLNWNYPLANSKIFWTEEGPAFTVTAGDDDDEDDRGDTVQGPSGSNYIVNAYDCNFSTSVADDSTIKVGQLFVDGNDTDTYLEQVYNAYYDNWGRYPRCTEMQFHLDHSTPISKLTAWLQEETIGEKYGCSYSTTQSDDLTIRVSSMFTLGSDTDDYLNEVYNAYYGTWGRYPRCTEMQFHLDHSTPLTRLTNWLEENIPEETTKADIPETPAEITGPKIEFKDSGNTMIAEGPENMIFNENDIITFTGTTVPNSMVKLVIASDGPMEVITRSGDAGYWTYTMQGPLEAGEHTVKVSVYDSEGTTVSASKTVVFTLKPTSGVTKAMNTISTTIEDTATSTLILIGVVIVAVIALVIFSLVSKKKKTPPSEPKQ